MSKKLIIPAEVKVCATCSYWDGERAVDPELRVVVIADTCQGECLVQGKCCQGLNDEGEWQNDCLWEHLAPDEVSVAEGELDGQQGAGEQKKLQ